MATRICKQCKRELPATGEYYRKDRNAKDECRAICKECMGSVFGIRRYKQSAKIKICPKCKKELPNTTEYFYETRKGTGVLRSICLECDKKARRERYARDPEASARYYQKRMREDPNFKPLKEGITNRWREDNKEQLKIEWNSWSGRNKDRLRCAKQKRRSKKKELPYTLKVEEWNAACLFFDNKCAYCGKEGKTLTQDHFIPLSKGGGYTAENIIPACGSCNSSKKNRWFEDWYPKNKNYSTEREEKIYLYLRKQKEKQKKDFAKIRPEAAFAA